MKIISLEAENIKRLKAVEITPDGTVQVIGGRNAQGKSSVLDAIWLALGGGQAGKSTVRPIRDGEDDAHVRLDLGDLVVTRSWKRKGSGGQTTHLMVTAADGAKYSSPQKMLDDLIGRLSFDPLAFARLSAREQRQALIDLVGIDTVGLDSRRRELFEQRTEVGRRSKAIGEATVDQSLPEAEQSAGAIIAEIRDIEVLNTEWQDRKRSEDALRQRCVETQREIERLTENLAATEKEFAEAQTSRAELPEPRNTSVLEARLATVEDTNAKIRANNGARAQAARKAELADRYDILTGQIDDLDQEKADALAKAEFPVEGLGFDDDGVTYAGVPFSQASSAEQIRVSLAMAMALNPKLRVLRITDGSLLDEDNLELIRNAAVEHDFQVWIEKVGAAGEGAVVIEDGQVAS